MLRDQITFSLGEELKALVDREKERHPYKPIAAIIREAAIEGLKLRRQAAKPIEAVVTGFTQKTFGVKSTVIVETKPPPSGEPIGIIATTWPVEPKDVPQGKPEPTDTDLEAALKMADKFEQEGE